MNAQPTAQPTEDSAVFVMLLMLVWSFGGFNWFVRHARTVRECTNACNSGDM